MSVRLCPDLRFLVQMLSHPKAEACFLAGTASEQTHQGVEDDDAGTAASAGATSKNKISYQCIDCLLVIAGIEKWGCTVPALRTWCALASADAVNSDKSTTSLITKEIVANSVKSKKTPKSQIKSAKTLAAFEDENEDLVKATEKKDHIEKVVKKVLNDYDALFAKHPKLKAKANEEMSKVVEMEYVKEVPFSQMNKAAMTKTWKPKDDREISRLKMKEERAFLLPGGFFRLRRRRR